MASAPNGIHATATSKASMERSEATMTTNCTIDTTEARHEIRARWHTRRTCSCRGATITVAAVVMARGTVTDWGTLSGTRK